MVTGALKRGFRNPFRSAVRAAIVILLLALVTGACALMVQAAFASREQIARLESRVRTLIELREAGAFGTGGFGGDKPIGEEHFSRRSATPCNGTPSCSSATWMRLSNSVPAARWATSTWWPARTSCLRRCWTR